MKSRLHPSLHQFALAVALLAVLPSALRADPTQLTQEEVERIVANAASEAAKLVPRAIIAVTDRDGFVLAVWDMDGRIPNPVPPFSFSDRSKIALYGKLAGAITRAGAAAFLSSNQQAFTSRTAGFIIQQHFPPGVRNTPNGPLVGVGLSSLFFSDVNYMKYIPNGFDGAELLKEKKRATTSPGVRTPSVLLGSLNDSPGGVPLYKDGEMVGGIGVTGDGAPTNLAPAAAIFLKDTQTEATTGFKEGSDLDELVALAGQTGFRPDPSIHANNVLINGIRIPYVFPRSEDIEDVHDPQPLGTFGQPVRGVPLNPLDANVATPRIDLDPKASPQPYPWKRETFGDFEGEVRFPLRQDPLLDDPVRGRVGGVARRLSLPEVEQAIKQGAARAKITRAGIRLPIGTSMKVFIAVVANPDKPGEKPEILGVFRTGEATIFSWDVAVQKARTAIFFSNSQLATSSRTVGFLAQKFFPPGIDGREHGPYFGFQEAVSLRTKPNPTGPFDLFPGNPNLPNGITIFPGGFPLYRDGKVIGAVGVSGDGVDQDDIVGASGTKFFKAAPAIRADQFTYHGARLPYAKFPRDPER